MFRKTRPVWAEVYLDNLAHNIREVRRVSRKNTIIMAVVKANAYGHGSIMAARTFLENGAERLAVATPTEAMELRMAGFKAPTLILGYTPSYQFGEVVDYNITPTIYRYEQAEALSNVAVSKEMVVDVHIKLDTGLGRLGFLPSEDSIDSIIGIGQLSNIKVEGLFTHFALAGQRDKDYTREQFKSYMRLVDELETRGLEIPIKHVANSATVIDLPEYDLDMVRPGTMLYGLYPSEEVDRRRVDLRPTIALKAEISNLKMVPKGTGISYGLTFTTDRQSRIGTLPVGYADGYARALSNRAEVGISGRRAPVVGTVCMDQYMIDLTDVGQVKIGDEVILFGNDSDNAPHIDEVAEWLGTVNTEVLCMISRRVPRVYIKGGEVVEVRDYLLN